MILRKKSIENLKNTNFDLVIIGDGFLVSELVLEATKRGLKVALFSERDFISDNENYIYPIDNEAINAFEKNDFIQIKKLEINRKELNKKYAQWFLSGRILFLKQQKGWTDFLRPVLNTTSNRYDKINILQKEEIEEREQLIPNLKQNKIVSIPAYRCNLQRIIIDNIRQAQNLGAVCLNYFKVEKTDPNLLINKELDLKIQTEKAIQINSKKNKSENGILNIILNKSNFPIDYAWKFQTNFDEDLFIIPQNQQAWCLLHLKEKTNKENDLSRFLNLISKFFPNKKLTKQEIISTWYSRFSNNENKILESSFLSKKIEFKENIFEIKSLINKVLNQISSIKDKSKTNEIYQEIPTPYYLIEYLDSKYDEAKQANIKVAEFKKLFFRYGTQIEIITEKAYEYLNENRETNWLRAEVWYSVFYENAISLSDFFIRRTSKIFFENENIETSLQVVANEMQSFLNWTSEKKEEEIKKMKNFM